MPNKLPSWLSSLWARFGATESVGREEFVPLLLRAAAAQSDGSLATMIQEITHHPPKTTLRAVELAILNQEAANPSDPANVWRTRGLAEAAPELAAQVFSQFDDVIARADDNAAFSRKLASGVLAFIFLTIYPVNSFDIISRLMNDKAIAASVAAKAGATDDPAKLREVIDQYAVSSETFSQANNPPPRARIRRRIPMRNQAFGPPSSSSASERCSGRGSSTNCSDSAQK